MTPKYFVVIPSKTMGNLLACVDALYQNEPDLEPSSIIIVDDGLNWTAAAQEILAGTILVSGAKPFVFARNVNLGIRATFPVIETTTHSSAEREFMEGPPLRTVIVLNDDALLNSHGGFGLLARALERHPEFGIIAAVTNVTGQPAQRPRTPGALRMVPNVAFICVAIPARTLQDLNVNPERPSVPKGLLDERYCIDYGMEDSDYCEAVTRAGLLVGVHDGCFVDHGSLVSSFRGDPKQPKSFARNQELFMAKWGVRRSA